MTTSTTPDFSAIADALLLSQCHLHPSELHGYLGGLLTAHSGATMDLWLAGLEEQFGDHRFQPDTLQALSGLFLQTQTACTANDYGVALLLPDDDAPLPERTEALGLWCQSFISGFGQGMSQLRLSDMAKEILEDFSHIAQIEAGEEDDAEAETLFMEVSEFVRVAWLNLLQEITTAAPTTH